METHDFVLIEKFCSHWSVESSFINSLHDFGLIEIVVIEGKQCIPVQQLGNAEKMVRFYYELNINIEGIDVISNLLSQIEDLRDELTSAKNRLKLFEGE